MSDHAAALERINDLLTEANITELASRSWAADPQEDTVSDDLNRLHPSMAPKVNANPLQRPGADRLVRRSSLGGLEQPADRWFLADADTLRHLLKIAESSPLRQARIPRCGVQVDLYKRRDGSTYEVWRIVGGKPEPEPLPAALASLRLGVGADRG